MERDRRTDVRRVKEILPVTTEYDPMDYIDLNKGIFIGLSREGEPQYMPLKNGRPSTPTLSAPLVPVKAS